MASCVFYSSHCIQTLFSPFKPSNNVFNIVYCLRIPENVSFIIDIKHHIREEMWSILKKKSIILSIALTIFL